jgi:hypothetical protein
MITIYKTTEHGLEIVPEVCKGCWISAVDPSATKLPDCKSSACLKSSSPIRWMWMSERVLSEKTATS